MGRKGAGLGLGEGAGPAGGRAGHQNKKDGQSKSSLLETKVGV